MLPPRIVRRLVLAPLVLVITIALLTGLPFLVIVAAAAAPRLPRRGGGRRGLNVGGGWGGRV